jgi:hypothetical protein
MYAKEPDIAELAAAGLKPEDFENESVEIWPENERAADLFSKLSTQWRIGLSGPTGLDYTPMFRMMDRMQLSDENYDALFSDMRFIERIALDCMNQKE